MVLLSWVFSKVATSTIFLQNVTTGRLLLPSLLLECFSLLKWVSFGTVLSKLTPRNGLLSTVVLLE